jgi:hypothetical protein
MLLLTVIFFPAVVAAALGAAIAALSSLSLHRRHFCLL